MKIFHLIPTVVAILLLLAESSNVMSRNLNSHRQLTLQENLTDPMTGVSDTFSENATRDWLQNFTDKNGNQIFNGDPEEDALQRKVFNGLAAGSQFGQSVNSAGDLNGDGYDDIIVGAPGYNSNTGRVYIYLGGTGMNTVPDVTLTGEATSSFYGQSVSTAGDVNGDGYSDVIIGAYGYTSSTGKAYIYFGGAVINNTADLTMTGEATSNYFGYSVSSAGDVNGDGYSDVIVGAYGYSSASGKAYIYFGGPSMNNVSDLTMTGEAINNSFGFSVSSAGDVNGDGYSDVIAGAYGYSSYTGKAYIYFGGAVMNNTSDVTMTGGAANNYFGLSVSSAGDVNGDGYSDVIAGAYGYSYNTGRSYIFLGGGSMNGVEDVTITGESTLGYFGISVSSAGDVNGDGNSDVIIGARGYSSSTGAAFMYLGGTTMNNTPDITVTGEATYNYFGRSVSSAGDVNGDGYSDMLVGAEGYSSNTGRVYLYDYYMSNELFPDITFSGEATNDRFGISVSTAGDVNGDGYSDIIIGSYRYSSSIGRAYIFYGGPNMDNVADVTLNGEGVNSYFGISVSSAGDINGDGYSDVIVGAHYYSSFTGRAYIFFGGEPMNNTADVTMTGEDVSNNFGYRVSTAGDVNGDGYSDVIVGASGYSVNTGRVYVYFGGSTVDNSADVTLTGDSVYRNFGSSISSAGDVNGDGYSDVIIGAYGFANYTGKAYLFNGGSSMNSTVDLILTGDATYSYFGYSVSSAGDINSDGYSDFMVGAYGSSQLSGKVNVYYGNYFIDNIPDITLTGGSQGAYFGYSVSNAGDINGDGYSDVIIGANNYNVSVGRAYVFFGGVDMNTVCDVLMTGEADYYYLGVSVGSAGDINGDGYSDVLVGAYGYSSYTGKAFVYKGSAISVKPILNYVKDVPNDQGGKVKLKWSRSGLDAVGNNQITDYYIEMSYPPSGGNFSWIPAAVVSATKNQSYSYNINTPYDSSSLTTGNFYFRVTARTSNPSVFWRSAVLTGRSIDNIAPLMVSPFTASSEYGNINLNWNRSIAPDLLNYILYRSTSSSIDPDTEPVFAYATDSTYLDTAPLSGVYYYFIVAQDIHNNKSPVTVAESPNITLNLTMFVEGLYNSGSNLQSSDTLTVQLRNTVSPFTVADVAKTVVGTNGSAVLKFGTAPDGIYYFAIKHRNSLETWSFAPLAFSRTSPANFNLSTSASQAFGNNMMQADVSPVRFAIYSGDVNQDGTVDATDVSAIDNDASNFITGYIVTDLTGDNFVDATDFAIADNNAAAFVGTVHP